MEYYFSLFRMNHLLTIAFYINNKDYNSQIIKIFLFFLILDIHFIVNALFFNDDNMHKIYTDNGSYNFIYQLPQILYSSVISGVIKAFIKFLALSEKNIIKFKNEIKKENIDSKFGEIKTILKIKFSSFFILSFTLLFLFSFYIICFCVIYIHTQYHLIKDTIASFATSLITPFIMLLMPGIFRISALQQGNKNYQYKFSQFLSSIL